MSKSFIFFIFVIFFSTNLVLAEDWTFIDSLKSYNLGSLNGQGNWTVTNYYGNNKNSVIVSTEEFNGEMKYAEIINNDSLIVSHNITPVSDGVFQLRMRHDKSGLFYFYALTSDEGGQLLFSIQFTESDGLLLEEGDKQVTLLSDYNANQWYLFTIDFDKTRGDKGTFKVKIDDGDYNEYKYVNSQSSLFDFSQILFGSNSSKESISAFSDIKSISTISLITADIDNIATSTITTVDIDGMSIVTLVNDTSTTTVLTTETKNTDLLANIIGSIFGTTTGTENNEISKDFFIATSTENEDVIIVSDKDEASIISPISEFDEESTTVTPETESKESSISADINDNIYSEEIVTSEF